MKNSSVKSPEFIKEKMSETVAVIIRETVAALKDFTQLNDAKKFTGKYLTKVDLSGFDSNQKLLYKKIIELTTTDLELFAREKGVNINSTFEFMAKETKDNKLKDHLLESIAFPHVKKFMDMYIS